MYPKLAILAIFLWSIEFGLAIGSTRIYFSRCGGDGFNCTTINKKHQITYSCPNNQNDVTFHLWQFRAPSTIESLHIQNCTNLRLSFACTSENRPIVHFAVSNITNLFINKATFTHTPPTVEFNNIRNFEYIPEETFSQIRRRVYKPGCANPTLDFQNLLFNNVTIGTIAPRAFNELKSFLNFSWHAVKVERLQHLAIDIDFDKKGNFSITRCRLEILESLAIKLMGMQAVFTTNKIVDLSPSAINGSIKSFEFSGNDVTNMQAYSISILSENVQILHNRFEYLNAGALERISPGLLYTDHFKNFGSLKFIYVFKSNEVNFMDAGSLNPDMVAFENVATDLEFSKNRFFCSCENMGWLLTNISHGYRSTMLQNFYETIMDDVYKNTCSYTSCSLTIKAARKLLVNGECLDLSAEELCSDKTKALVPSEDIKRKTKVITTSGSGHLQPFFCIFMNLNILATIVFLIF